MTYYIAFILQGAFLLSVANSVQLAMFARANYSTPVNFPIPISLTLLKGFHYL
ncbi:MAG: hypothetical protein ACI9FB_003574 [Candidatus Azotimanducaceae bacterium]|jgi:hypothetical protein